MKKILLLIICLSFNLHAGINQQAVSDYKIDNKQNHVLEIAKSLQAIGVLKMKSNGYVYLDISNEYITKIFPNLILDGHLRRHFHSDQKKELISQYLRKQKVLGLEQEIGKEFTFEVKELRTVESWKTTGLYGTYKHHTGDR